MTHDIGLSSVGIELDARGFIRVNERLETTAPSTWALGDCAGSRNRHMFRSTTIGS
jgi:pyruvate/2-oxoglutarate dehydrogenase complex dihydrolipoamide dehydrogenase (E3) component